MQSRNFLNVEMLEKKMFLSVFKHVQIFSQGKCQERLRLKHSTRVVVLKILLFHFSIKSISFFIVIERKFNFMHR